MKPQRDVDFHAPDSMETIPFGASFPAGHLVNPNSGYRTFAPNSTTSSVSAACSASSTAPRARSARTASS